MKTNTMKYALLGLSAIALSIVALPHNAQASSYSAGSLAPNNEINLDEVSSPSSGFYIIPYSGVVWQGTISNMTAKNVTGSVGGPGVEYRGTFAEQSTANSTLNCSGSIIITRYKLAGGNYRLAVVKTASSGNSCSSRLNNTQKFGMDESLPIANGSGEFNLTNSQTQLIVPNGHTTWPQWKVVDPSGLNCRATPGGSLIRTFSFGASMTVVGGGTPSGGFGSVGGASWLKVLPTGTTATACFVRAKSTYIAPIQIPF